MTTFNVFILTVISLVKIFSSSDAENYLIQTDSCAVPNLPVDIPEFQQSSLNATEFTPIKCSLFDELFSYITKENNSATLRLNNNSISEIYGSEEALNCCYSYVYRNGTTEFPDEGISTSPCVPFVTDVALQHDIVWVKCTLLTTEILVYENIHQTILLTEEVEQKTKLLKTKAKPISILFVVVDGISRLNFVRTMPKTREYILENNFYEFKGYNKINDNTFPNFMAWLSGMNLTDSLKLCNPKTIDGLSNCPLIWYTYRRLGYATAYAEDWSTLATFNYFKKGFKYPPTDYYFKPYMDATDKLYVEYQDTMPFCTGPEPAGERILNLANDFTRTIKGLPSFGVFWMNTFSHNNMNTTRRMDLRMKRFFETLKRDGILDESIVFFLSDHGNRFGNLIGTPRGYFEERLPMNYVYLPTWFKNQFRRESENFENNSKKLTSTYDIYVTLQHLLVLSGVINTIEPSRACSSCLSLFQKLPENRSCLHAGIPEEWCSCIGALKQTNLNSRDMVNLQKAIQQAIDGPIRTQLEKDDFLKSTYAYNIESVVESESRKNIFRNNEILKYMLIRFVTNVLNAYRIMFLKSNSDDSLELIHIRRIY